MLYLKKYIRKYIFLFLLGVILVTLEAICDLFQPAILAKIIDIGVQNKDLNYLLNQSIIMIGITVLGAIFAVLRSIISTNVSQRFARDLRSDLFKHINYYSLEDIDKITRASLITRLTNDVNQVQQFVNSLMRIIIKAPILCIGSFILAIKLNLELSIILFIGIVLIFIVIIINLKIGIPYFKKIQISLDDMNSNLRQYLENVRIVNLFNRLKYEKSKFEKVNNNLAKSTKKAMKVSSVFKPTITLISNIVIILILYLGNKLFISNKIEIGVIVAYINYMGRILTSLLMISHIFNIFIRAKASGDRIIEVFDMKVEKDQKAEVEFDIRGDIKFENVNFSYNNHENTLKDISFEINDGEHIGIIGPTGSGKSTIINLIIKLYKIDKGIIKFNDKNIDNLNAKTLRKFIGIVPQKNILFNQSIADNIKFGNKNIDTDEIKNICKICDCDGFIESFEKGYDESIDEGGSNLSGGQRQRICIARALIRNPKVLILDDSFSAMDIKTENKILKNIKTKLYKTTLIVVSQKINSIINMDKIMVLDNGEIVGFDSHDKLIEKCQVYKEIYNSQISIDI
ncbi:ABC transporter ATP-binding protein/permease,Lipid A export ATP-binding/permease protein MsbA,lipid transporter ATP-binding/permease protein,ABC-type bacteriocin/lantibiotic exporters, contain an N-terminal double-glycine peptidase domain,lipid A export permease/ATP-binding protein MsbA,ABC transporter transmembrane region [[Clostridium] sordellii]|uniref:ABC transporter ATP-binding protein n=1 Tax=Paraclostridium sordellii TaxID=1505 RepID=UPI0005437995|nr:ABC transporter ATP-binding protein [Paeniclostridium sordellii]CEK33422.1 ABC transporter ATP-binding protein/permease,Lipid A export ATP-binding/permease protein MsbA,lipid transporter ATP-binding/permease protein,ABC-type bacteriocin/lantibiotic exporters, contain an N-terminal double-glycine peptidase domain,lipid A export permease/ATP-binding protein MsbA,ABC transporter transmembrane region [[Clostridium] sordellii] [Paeniclostridium sordellii]